jgi:threonine dehydratase
MEPAMDLTDITQAAGLLAEHLSPSPLIHSASFSEACGGRVWLKLENLSPTGSFKIRGALNRLLTLDPAELKQRGVVAASAGNHAQGVALAAARLGVKATILMPDRAPLAKQEATRHYGAEVNLVQGDMAATLAAARSLAETGPILIHPFDDEQIMAGQGTIGLEIVEKLPDVDLVVTPVGGGGLISGIATAVKAHRPRARVIGVQAEAAPAAVNAFRAGRVLQKTPGTTVADGIALPAVGHKCFEVIERLVDDVVAVSERDIYLAMLALIEKKHLVAEGAGAVPAAALTAGRVGRTAGQKIVLVISGGNLDVNVLGRILHKGLVQTGRILRLTVDLPDEPGSLAGLTAALAGQKANVLDIDHDRLGRDSPVDVSRVILDVEVRGEEHGQEVREALGRAGYNLNQD